MQKHKPVIGITTDYKDKYYGIEKTYSRAIAATGGLPVLIPSLSKNKRTIKETVHTIDGLLIPGSTDMDPKHYNQKPHKKLNPMSKERTESEFIILNEALKNNIPVFGICGGMQFINVFYGGTLYQDIGSLLPHALNHEKGATHSVSVIKSTNLYKIVNKTRFKVKSYHHQAVKKVGSHLIVSATSDDGLAEGLETKDGMIFAVQWHPELESNNISKSLFKQLISKSASKHT